MANPQLQFVVRDVETTVDRLVFERDQQRAFFDAQPRQWRLGDQGLAMEENIQRLDGIIGETHVHVVLLKVMAK